MIRTRSGLQITNDINLWQYLRGKLHETQIVVQYQLDIGRALTEDEQEHVKRFFRGLITEDELLSELAPFGALHWRSAMLAVEVSKL